MSEADDLRSRLHASRRALLEALHGLTERDFASPFDGTTVAWRLAALARAEREAVRHVRRAVSVPGRGAPPGTAPAEDAQIVPPQAIHDLAGARHETLLLLGALQDADLDANVNGESARDVLESLAEHEARVAERIRARLHGQQSGETPGKVGGDP